MKRASAGPSGRASPRDPGHGQPAHCGLGGPAGASRRRQREPRPVGEHGHGLAERQPQRQQLALPGRRHRPVPARRRGPELPASTRSTSTTTSRRAATRPTTSSRRGTSRTPRARSAAGPAAGSRRCARSCRRRRARAFPIDGYRVDGLTVHGRGDLLGRAAPADDLGRHDHLDHGPTHCGSAERQQLAPTSSCGSDRPARPSSSRGVAISPSRPTGTGPRGGPSDGAGQVSGAPWHMRTLQLDGAGNKNQDRSIQPSAIVGELPPFALAPPTPTPRPPAPPAGPVPTPRPPGGGPGGPGPGNPGSPQRSDRPGGAR